MLEKERMIINCDLCDARTIKEENYSSYEHIIINADVLLVNEKSKGILSRLPITSNVDEVMELDNDKKMNLQSVNGCCEMTNRLYVPENTILCVNGCLKIEPGAEKVLESYQKICVNGCVKCPKSLEGGLGRVTVNGSTEIYPDDCTILDDCFVPDRYFALRARDNGRYYAKNEVVLADEEADIAMLVQKKVQFVTKQLVVPESKAEESIPLIDETVKLTVVPQGQRIVCGDVLMNDELLDKYGDKLYIYGNLTVTEESLQALAGIKHLTVSGEVLIKRNCLEAFEAVHAEYGKRKLIRKEIRNKSDITIDAFILSETPEGFSFVNVGQIVIREDVTPKMITELLEIRNCGSVRCNVQQKSAVELISVNAGMIRTEEDRWEEAVDQQDQDSIWEQLKSGINFLKGMKEINADSYIM